MNRSTPLTPTATVKLDPSVDLVPVQVVVMRSANYPALTDLARQLAIFDQIHAPTPVYVSNGQTGEFETVLRGSVPGVTWAAPRNDAQVSYPLYYANGYASPDSVWARCGVQFRLINYFEMTVPDKLMYPKEGDSNVPPEDPTYFPDGTWHGTPCTNRAALVEADPRNMNLIPTLIYSTRESFHGAVEVARAIPGTVCAPFSAGVYPTLLAHEFGHLGGLPDCSSNLSTCRLMESAGGGVAPPTDSECAGIKAWAHDRSNYFRSQP